MMFVGSKETINANIGGKKNFETAFIKQCEAKSSTIVAQSKQKLLGLNGKQGTKVIKCC